MRISASSCSSPATSSGHSALPGLHCQRPQWGLSGGVTARRRNSLTHTGEQPATDERVQSIASGGLSSSLAGWLAGWLAGRWEENKGARKEPLSTRPLVCSTKIDCNTSYRSEAPALSSRLASRRSKDRRRVMFASVEWSRSRLLPRKTSHRLPTRGRRAA